nr:FctA domain-containing protein [Bifidobacterium pseudolongum]
MDDPTDPRSTGRVWTDKSVSTKPVTLTTYKGDTVTVTPAEGSFLVGLSAMSSAQKLVGVSNVTKPLDIVLVLDTSSSMAYGMDGNHNPGYSYQPVYANQLDKNKKYYIPNGNDYREVSWNSQENSWGYNVRGSWTSAAPKTSADDADGSHVQFYTRAAASRMNVLQQAVNGFIDQTIAANAKVSDPNKKNRIGLVTYASSATTRSGLTDSLEELKDAVNDLPTTGVTRADSGLENANTVLNDARADASKIVIFFTDGQPTSSYAFDAAVANRAIATAKTMKESGASVYSIGIFEGADPTADVSNVTSNSNTTLRSNAFMQGVSSNYPDATAYTELGRKAADANYYLAASDADALNAVFDTIWREVSSNPTSPIQAGTTEGNGVVTFTDQLGDYMGVTRMNSIVFAGQQYSKVSSQTSADGSQTTYTFEGKVEANEIYKEADLSTMQIVVTHNEGKTGDLVTVNVPAELLPLRLYTANVDKDGNVTTSINRTNPMRLFYEVNLKDGTLAKVANPDEQMRQYLADPANIDTDGSVRFLTNAYNTSTNGADGSTTAVFTPATTNDFYYFTQDTPLYNSESLNDPATSIEAEETYHYQRTYYANNAKHEQWIEVLGANAEGKVVADADGHYYAPVGAVRTGLARRYTAAKESNPTGTAANAIAPHWEMNNVTVNLGNNGLRKVARPGALEVTEIVEWTDGEMPQAIKSKAFPFTLALSGVGADGEYQAVIAGQNTTVKNGAQFSLKHGESVMVYGLPAGAKATVTQTDAGGKGWSVNHTAAEGSITAGETTQLGFVNQYTPDPVTLPEGSISGAKTLMERDWQPDESFTFQIAAGDSNPEAPMPEQPTVTVTNPGGADAYRNGQRIPFAFGAITYTKPGTYQYVITEQGGGKPGMQYSGARYIATVTVTDNGDGTMSAAAVLTNTFGDDGAHIEGEPKAESADFTNTFLGENNSVATIRGIKHYTDHTGTKPNNVPGTFNVMITPDEGNPANGPTFKNDVLVGVDGTWARELQFTNEALNAQHEQTFTYHVREIVPEGVGSDNPTKDGMTYDVNTYDVQITVSRDEQQNLITRVTYPDGGERVELTNSYRAQNTDAQALGVTKAVTGRDAEAGKFTFDAVLRTNNAQYVKVEQSDGTLKDWATASVRTPAITKGTSADIDFGSLVFTMPGTYTFAVREQLPDGASAANPKVDGWTYDTHTHTVTYTVTDSNGKLKAAEVTDGSATFTNAYTAQVNYGADGAMRIGKTLTGRAMNAQEFSFAITPIDGAPMPNGAQSVTTSNPFSAVSGQELVWPVPGTLLANLTFTQDDAGKTYRYTIREVLPEGVTEDNPKKNGVTYDLTEHTVSITVIDNGKGTLTTETKVDGQADGVAHFANTYTIAKGESAVGFAKAITGRDWKSGESFTFELTPNTDQSSVSESVLKAAMPKGASVTVGKPDSGRTAAFAFNGFTFGQPGTYVYNVREQGAGESKDGLTNDARTALVSFTVADKGDGTYSIGRLITDIDFEDGVNTFTNAYKAKEFTGVPTGMAFSKELKGTEWTSDRAFEFTLEAVTDGAPMPEQATISVGKPAKGNKADFAFGSITYSKTGVYEYVVKEVQGGMLGVSYDDHSAKVTVTVTDDGNGQLKAEAVVSEGAFSNTYTAKPFEGVPSGLELSKQLTGIDWPEDRAFEFTLEAVTKDAPMPAEAKVSVGKPAEGDTAVFNFGTIRYEKAGEYEYTVKEAKGDMPGVSYDAHSATVKVTVSDNGEGQLEATAVVTDGAFVNIYGAEPSGGVPEGMTFIKQLTGIDWPADRSFEFTLAAKGDAPMPQGAKDGKLNVAVGKPADGNAAAFDFGAITYTAEGEYKYTVTEVAGDMPGVAYAKNTATVTVTVKDDKQGKLIAKAAVEGNVFVNAYSAREFTGVPVGMAFSKELTGIDWPEGRAFDFALEAVTKDAPMPAEAKISVGKPDKGAKADFTFGEITYTKTGTYEYTVKEAKGDMPGVSYDTHSAKAKVTVTDNGKGQLEATATVTEGAFTNVYTAQQVTVGSADLGLSKQLTGIAWPADRSFEFTLEGKGDAPMPEGAQDGVLTKSVGKPAQGDTAAVAFGDITYTKAGVYEYMVKETKGDMPGVSYDTHEAKVTVTVADNGKGQLEADVRTDGGKFVNAYTAVPATGVPTDFTLTKRVEGMEWNADQKFEFTIQAQGGAPMPKNATVTVGKPANGDTATFDFGEIVFERAGVYRYTVTETAGSHPGMVYDGHTATITVDVADDGQGHLVTATTVVNGLFTNTYSTQTVAYPGVDVTEDLTGRAQAQGEFQFVVSGSADDMARAGYTTRAVTSPAYEFAAAASGETVTVPGLFTGLELTHDDVRAGRKFVYEVDQTGAQSGNGLTVDDRVYRVEIWATDNGDGTMRVHTSINGVESTDPTPVLPFHNVYATAPVTIGGDAQVRINARKTLHGRALADGEFRFVVRDAKGAQLAGGTNAASGVVNFDAIEFTDARLISDVQAGIATAHVDGTRTVYRYEVTVSELTDALPAGITALESGFAATLVITDNGQGKLEAAVEYPADADGTLGFVNQYGAASEVSLGLNGNKVLAVASGNNAPDITGKYTFTLSGSQGAPMPQKTTAVNDAAGAVDFGQITYTMANVFGEQEAKPEEPKADENADGSDDASDAKADDVTTREKTFTYTVTESGSVAGVANDASAQRTITVHVKDNGDGTLTVSKESAASGTDFTFTNTYGVRPTDPVSPTDTSIRGGVPLTKTLNGRNLKAGEFTFELIEAASGKVVGTAANAVDGSVSLPGVVFEAPGSYAYLVRELAGTAGGVTYDSRVYAAVATVVDNGDGTLGASWTVTEPAVGPVEAMVFENTYAAQPTSVQISAGKMLLGRDLKAGEFGFTLKALDSAPMPHGAVDGVQTVQNDGQGNAQFGVIDYAQSGEYRYTVSEVKGDAEGVTYDETEHAVVVRVADNGEGQLLATVDYGDGEQGVVFTNTYTKPEEPDTPDTPGTPETPQYPASGTPTYRPYSYSTSSRPYTGTIAYTGADVALIVAVAAVLLAAGVALLAVARRRQ